MNLWSVITREFFCYLLIILNLDFRSRGVVVTGYGPLGGPGETTLVNGHTPINNPLVVELAEKYNKSTGQILLRFQVQRGIAIVAKSVTPSYCV